MNGALDRTLVDALGWTLLHFVWQGSLIAGALAIADLLLRRSSAKARYLAACSAMALMLVIPTTTFLRAPRPASVVAAWDPKAMTTNGAAGAVSGLVSSPPSSNDRWDGGERVLRGNQRQRSRPSRNATTLPAMLPWLVALWCFGVVVLSVRLIGGWWLTRRILARSLEAPLVELDGMLASLKRRLALSAPVRICRSALVEVPTVIGCLRPVILLPVTTLTGLSLRQIESLLAHELAHIRRHDYLVNLLQSIVETLLFYHPGVWWVSRRAREERENCCDDVAVAVCGDPLTYARALTELETLRLTTPHLAMAASGGSLLGRIQRLMRITRPRLEQPSAWMAGLVSAGAAFVLLLGAGLGLGAVSPDASHRVRALRLATHTQVVRAIQRAAEAQVRVARLATRVGQAAGLATVAPAAIIAGDSVADGTETEASEASPAVPAEKAMDAADALDPADAADAADPEADGEPAARPCSEKAHSSNNGTEEAFDHRSADEFLSRGVDEDYVRGGHSAGFSDDDVILMHDHGLSADYVQAMRGRGMPTLTAAEIVRLHDHGVPPHFVRGLTSEGQPSRSVDELVELQSHGISLDYIQQLGRAGYPVLPTRELVLLQSNGVSADYAQAIKRSGHPQFTPLELVAMVQHGVSAELVRSLAESGRADIPVDRIIQLSDHGVGAGYVSAIIKSVEENVTTEAIIALHDQGISTDWIAAMVWLGYDSPQSRDLITLQQQGVTPEFIFGFRTLGYRNLTANDLIRMRIQGVDPDEVALLRSLGLRDLTVNDIIALRVQGVTAEYVVGMRRVGVRKLDAKSVIQLRMNGVSPEEARSFADAGLGPLTAADLARLRANGVDASFAREAARAGTTRLTVDELIELRRNGSHRNGR